MNDGHRKIIKISIWFFFCIALCFAAGGLLRKVHEPSAVSSIASEQQDITPPAAIPPLQSRTEAEARISESVVKPTQESTSVSEPDSRPLSSSNPTSKMSTDRTYPEFWVWAGIGANYQFYQQTIPSLAGSAKFQNIQAPTWSCRAGAQGESFGMEASYQEARGSMEGSAGTTTQNGEYTWKSLSTEVLYRPKASPWRFRGGLQYHQMPFMNYNPSTKIFAVQSSNLALATLGFDRFLALSKKLTAEWQMRYQHPLMSGMHSGGDFETTPVFTFDGSLGFSYKVDERFRLGIFWYGQYHNYKFSYAGATSFSGEQTLFYSNAELRLGWEF